MAEHTIHFVPLSATREEHPRLANEYTFSYLEAVITDTTVTLVRISTEDDPVSLTLSHEDFIELGAAYEALIHSEGPHERVFPAGEINSRGVASLQRPRPTL